MRQCRGDKRSAGGGASGGEDPGSESVPTVGGLPIGTLYTPGLPVRQAKDGAERGRLTGKQGEIARCSPERAGMLSATEAPSDWSMDGYSSMFDYSGNQAPSSPPGCAMLAELGTALLRGRVIVYNTQRVGKALRALEALADLA